MSEHMTTIGIMGLGRMGIQLARRATTICDHVIGFDVKPTRVQRLQGLERVDSPEAMGVADLIILAVPSLAVPELAEKYAACWTNACVVDICTQRESYEDVPLFGVSRVIMAKLIAEADMLAEGEPGSVLLSADASVSSTHLQLAKRLFDTVGKVSLNLDCNDSGNINRIAAHAAMQATLNLTVQLRALGADTATVAAAVGNVFIGTAKQYPFTPPDYFHRKVLSYDPDLAEIYTVITEDNYESE